MEKMSAIPSGDARLTALEALLRAAEQLQSQLDEQGILHVIATQLAGVVPYDNGLSVYMLTHDGTMLSPVFADGAYAAEILAEPPLSVEHGISGSVVRSGRARLENDAVAVPDAVVVEGTRQGPDDDESMNLLAVPLRSREKALGVLLLYRRLEWPFVPEDLSLAQLFANQAAIAIENARLFGAALELADGLQTAQNIALRVSRLKDVAAIAEAIGDELAQLLSYDAYRVFLYDPQTDDLTEMVLGGPNTEYTKGPQGLRVPMGVGVTGWVAAHREPQLIDDLDHDPRAVQIPGTEEGVKESLMAVPLIYDDRLLGVVTVSRRGLCRFKPSHLRILTILGGQVAAAIENARLLARERQRINMLEELDSLRSDFVSTVSHELRTPLTSIIGFTESLQGYWDRMADAKKREMLDKIRVSSLRLERLVRDLLYISRVEAGNVHLQLEPVDLARVVATAIEEISGKYHGEHIVVEAPDTPLRAVADHDRCCQVVVNLIDNAIKYSPEGMPVTVRWVRANDRVLLTVTDCGRGISEDDMPRLFTRFGKIGTTIRAGHIGTGLGLYISRGLVEAMNGYISVQSVPDKGSIFTVTLPLAP